MSLLGRLQNTEQATVAVNVHAQTNLGAARHQRWGLLVGCWMLVRPAEPSRGLNPRNKAGRGVFGILIWKLGAAHKIPLKNNPKFGKHRHQLPGLFAGSGLISSFSILDSMRVIFSIISSMS
jgi:hypothetical protein